MSELAVNYRAGGDEGRPKPTDEWRTPLDLYRVLDDEFGFELDAACSTENLLAPRGLCRDRAANGLVEAWMRRTWCNPPYSNVRPWLIKARVEADRGNTSVLLIPADPSTRWWRDLVARYASEVRFLVGRPKFRRPDGSRHDCARGGGGTTTPIAVVVFAPGRTETRYAYMNARQVNA